ncbi:LIVCS family branched-chain amino acid:cation transporter [Scopulibacillus darangshiensis]|uniref:Branched-chain amino acid transport system carrier protein n=1 Tax=Scopulibacillus darangshiensis TaxID=442528 RepID=A0A4R2NDI9_9BACL|nr:branched-chain amino acid transport system II carrier protein [Scopulibacillus darangshiensis]TCP19148.1 LIVCS family branched-chain amino acid:cation transporter [Scopulibacillus darangshiensis]
MRKKDTLFVGLMLFSMFFGAGNLIFPPFLGMSAGTSYGLAITGFIVTSVGLPLLVITVLSLVKGGVRTLGSRVHPLFGAIFTVIVYLSIGPFLGIPRNATVAYEMGVKPFLGHSPLLLFLFTLVFFTLVCFISLNPSKMADYMGKWITPTLLLAMVILCSLGLSNLNTSSPQAPTGGYEKSPFFKGFIEGYSTMDALAALAFGIVILSTLKQKGIQNGKLLTKYALKAGLIAGTVLALVYIGLGFMGVKMASHGSFENGTMILSAASNLLFGQGGKILLGVIFTLACFTTCVGLTTACGQFFEKLIPKASYKTVVLIISLISFMLANFGLNKILTVSVPFLVMAYSLTIVLIVLAILHRVFGGSKKVYGCTILFTGVVAIFDGLKAFGLDLGPVQEIADKLPFAGFGLGWIVPAVAGFLIGIVLEKLAGRKSAPVESQSKRAS